MKKLMITMLIANWFSMAHAQETKLITPAGPHRAKLIHTELINWTEIIKIKANTARTLIRDCAETIQGEIDTSILKNPQFVASFQIALTTVKALLEEVTDPLNKLFDPVHQTLLSSIKGNSNTDPGYAFILTKIIPALYEQSLGLNSNKKLVLDMNYHSKLLDHRRNLAALAENLTNMFDMNTQKKITTNIPIHIREQIQGAITMYINVLHTFQTDILDPLATNKILPGATVKTPSVWKRALTYLGIGGVAGGAAGAAYVVFTLAGYAIMESPNEAAWVLGRDSRLFKGIIGMGALAGMGMGIVKLVTDEEHKRKVNP